MCLMWRLTKKDSLLLGVIMVFSKVSTKSKVFLLKFVNRLIETVLFFIKKIYCFGMNISEISMWLSSLFYINILIWMAHSLFSPVAFFLKIVCREKLLLLWKEGELSLIHSTWTAPLGTRPGVDWQNGPLSNFPIFGIFQKKWHIKNSRLDVTVVWKNSSIAT